MTENVNGLQVDISKYVGEEIARLAVASIGEDTFVLTMEEVVALFAGATLGDPNFDEYGTFIRLEGNA